MQADALPLAGGEGRAYQPLAELNPLPGWAVLSESSGIVSSRHSPFISGAEVLDEVIDLADAVGVLLRDIKTIRDIVDREEADDL